jgi:hypothetical protein
LQAEANEEGAARFRKPTKPDKLPIPQQRRPSSTWCDRSRAPQLRTFLTSTTPSTPPRGARRPQPSDGPLGCPGPFAFLRLPHTSRHWRILSCAQGSKQRGNSSRRRRKALKKGEPLQRPGPSLLPGSHHRGAPEWPSTGSRPSTGLWGERGAAGRGGWTASGGAAGLSGGDGGRRARPWRIACLRGTAVKPLEKPLKCIPSSTAIPPLRGG